jgi:DNA-directed RNA polymerase subunit RPC12/RpoP
MTRVKQRYLCSACEEPQLVRVQRQDAKTTIEIGCPECGQVAEHRPKGVMRWF